MHLGWRRCGGALLHAAVRGVRGTTTKVPPSTFVGPGMLPRNVNPGALPKTALQTLRPEFLETGSMWTSPATAHDALLPCSIWGR